MSQTVRVPGLTEEGVNAGTGPFLERPDRYCAGREILWEGRWCRWWWLRRGRRGRPVDVGHVLGVHREFVCADWDCKKVQKMMKGGKMPAVQDIHDPERTVPSERRQ